ncbi:MAG: acylphosphatase, partial [Nitrospina sp.]|nr:acylphosphatase [Nitrospina sp.]
MSSAVHIIVSGRVQGVWFRGGTQERAMQLGVCGWAKNCPDGTV